MKGKIFTVDEANRMLPLVTRIADDIVSTYSDVDHALKAYEGAKVDAERDPGTAGQLQTCDAEVGDVLDRFQGLIHEMEALGGTVKDYEQGLVDFYGDVSGEIVYLCWTRGETSISHWHRLDEGFGKRRELPTVSAAA